MAIRTNDLLNDLLDDLWPYLRFDIYSSLGQQCPEKVISELEYWPGMTTKQFAAVHLCKSFLKKFQDGSNTVANAAALKKFIDCNNACDEWSPDCDSLKLDLLYGLFRQEMYNFFNQGKSWIISSLAQILSEGDVGPGASIGARGDDFYTKLFSSPLTCTHPRLYDAYARYLGKIPGWSRAEEERRDHFGDCQIVAGNRLSFVPKNRDASRVICTEPNLNMFFQKGIEAILNRRLKSYFGIDLATQQEVNRNLACIGSAFDNYSTIDLSSASDTISHLMLAEVLPDDLLAWFELCRSPMCTLPNGESVELHMFSSMGNAFTFPLQTIIFSCVVSSVYKAMDIPLQRRRPKCYKHEVRDGVYTQTSYLPNFGVNGDDIVVAKEAYHLTVGLLRVLGFTVNEEKSFCQGPFRESCGGDYFNGRAVRGVYIKSLRSQADRFVAINRLNAWSAQTDIPLAKTVARLVKGVRYLPVPLHEADDAGIKVPLSFVEHLKRDPDTKAIKYRFWASDACKITIRDGIFEVGPGMRSRIYNPEAFLQALLRGNVRSSLKNGKIVDTISVRHGRNQVRYRTKEAITSSWNRLPTMGVKTPIGQERLVTAIRRNLMV